MYRILRRIIEKIKAFLSQKKFVEIDLEYFGHLNILNNVFSHRNKNEDSIEMNVKKLLTPRSRKSSIFRISKKDTNLQVSGELHKNKNSCSRFTT